LLHGVCCFGTLGSGDLELLAFGILTFLLVVIGGFWHFGVWHFGLVVLSGFWKLDFCLLFSQLCSSWFIFWWQSLYNRQSQTLYWNLQGSFSLCGHQSTFMDYREAQEFRRVL
jgi:hypothetical protein